VDSKNPSRRPVQTPPPVAPGSDASAADPLLASLNPAQREAVLHDDGPLLVIAGAGSGKTRVITHRIARLIRDGTAADGILAITFTNKAAGEMRDRVEALLGVRSPWISTFHSFAARLLRRHIYRLPPYSTSFTIYDEEDVEALLREIVRGMDLDPAAWAPRSLAAKISMVKNKGVHDAGELPLRGRYEDQVFQEALARYGRGMQERNALDFDDLLLLTVRLFTTPSDLLDRYREQFRYVLIDEYQDTNFVQYRIGHALTEKSRNLCVTGDPDQSIYSWRGADPSNFRRFETDYPEAHRVTLDQNYRSTRRILRCANAVIRHNSDRQPKDLWSENPEGERVRIRRFADGREEAAAIAARIQELNDGAKPAGAIAVFYRINAFSREIERALILSGIPYVVVGGVAFFQRREVKDVLAYLRILSNPRDSQSLLRIINTPARRVGPAAVDRAAERAATARLSILDVVLSEAHRGTFPSAARRGLDEFAAIYRQLHALPRSPVFSLVEAVLASTNYVQHIQRSEGEEANERIRNVGELENAAAEYDDRVPGGDLDGFLSEIALLTSVDRWDDRKDRVSLMTLHSAKGLEFPAVFILGVEDGILPLGRSRLNPDAADKADLEEERRLLYVGITRAREELMITHTRERLRFGRPAPAFPSGFLEEMVDHDSEPGIDAGGAVELGKGSRGASGGLRMEVEDSPNDFNSDDGFGGDGDDGDDPFPPGARVRHPRYGEGTVVGGWGLGARRRLTIRFDRAGEKQMVLGFAKLMRIW